MREEQTKKEVKVVKADQIKAIQPLEPGCYERWVLNRKTPTKDLTLLMVSIDVDKKSGMHRHSVKECFFFLHGRGKAIIQDREYEIELNLCFYLPAEIPHDVVNTGKEPLVFLTVLTSTRYKTDRL